MLIRTLIVPTPSHILKHLLVVPWGSDWGELNKVINTDLWGTPGNICSTPL